jgi:hypothetical protein
MKTTPADRYHRVEAALWQLILVSIELAEETGHTNCISEMDKRLDGAVRLYMELEDRAAGRLATAEYPSAVTDSCFP